jgi:Lon-like ATP-dependent protease
MIKPVGGVVSKVTAAREAGVKKVYIPLENNQKLFSTLEGIEVVPVEKLEEVINGALLRQTADRQIVANNSVEVLTAAASPMLSGQ